MSILIIEQPRNIVGNSTSTGFSFRTSVIDTDNLPLTYQWEYTNDTLTGWRISTSNGSQTPTIYGFSYTFDFYLSRNQKYRCVVSNGAETVYTNVVGFSLPETSFSIILQTNNSEHICVTKDLTDIITVTGNLKEDCSIIDPVFLIEDSLSNLVNCNYCTISAFGRSYFVQNIVSVTNDLVELHCHVDVLSSFASQIKQNKGIVKRAEGADTYNLYINDDSLVAYQDPYILTEPFPNGFTGACFILTVAGA